MDKELNNLFWKLFFPLKEKIKKFWKWIIVGLILVALAVPLFFNEPLNNPLGQQFQKREREDLLSWNITNAVEVAPNKIEAWITGGESRFLNTQDKWESIDASLTLTAEGWCQDKAPFKACLPLTSQGIGKFIANTRFDLPSKTRINEPSLTQEITALGVANVIGQKLRGDLGWGTVDYVIYPNAYPVLNADLIYYIHQGDTTRLRELVRFNSTTTTDTILQFKLKIAGAEIFRKVNGQETKWTKQPNLITKERIRFKTTGKRGLSFTTPKIWYFDQTKTNPMISQEIDAELQALPNDEYIFTKTIPALFFASAILPVWTDIDRNAYPAPDTGGTTVDGYSLRTTTNETWANIIAGAGNGQSDTTGSLYAAYINSGTSADTWNLVVRNHLTFDTSFIGADDTVDSANLYIVGSDKVDNMSTLPDTNLYPGNPANVTTIANADYNNTGNLPLSTAITYANWSSTATNTFAFNSDGLARIAKSGQSTCVTSGITCLVTKNANFDVASTTPTNWSSNVVSRLFGNSADAAGTNNDPRLQISYTEVAVAAPTEIDEGCWSCVLWNYLIHKVYARNL